MVLRKIHLVSLWQGSVNRGIMLKVAGETETKSRMPPSRRSTRRGNLSDRPLPCNASQLLNHLVRKLPPGEWYLLPKDPSDLDDTRSFPKAVALPSIGSAKTIHLHFVNATTKKRKLYSLLPI